MTRTRSTNHLTAAATRHCCRGRQERERRRLRHLHREQGIRVVGEAGNGAEVRAAVNLKPRVLVLDIELRSSGLTLLRIVRRAASETKILLLADRLPVAGLLNMLFAGACGLSNVRLSA